MPASSCCAEAEVDEEGDGCGEGYLGKQLHDRTDREGRRSSSSNSSSSGGRVCGGQGLEVFLRALLDTLLAVVSYLL